MRRSGRTPPGSGVVLSAAWLLSYRRKSRKRSARSCGRRRQGSGLSCRTTCPRGGIRRARRARGCGQTVGAEHPTAKASKRTRACSSGTSMFLAMHGTPVTPGAMPLTLKPCEAVIELGPHPVLERRRLTDSGGNSPYIPSQSSEPSTTETRCTSTVSRSHRPNE